MSRGGGSVLWAALAGAFLAAQLAAASLCAADVTTASYQESQDSFTWELEWDGAVPDGELELNPPRPEGEGRCLWTSSVRIARNPASPRTARFVFLARHASRMHELDAPEGSAYRALLILTPPPKGPPDWTRLDGKQLPHLSTPKDHLDAVDVLWRVEASADGRAKCRLLFQASHGPGARPKKVKSPARKPPRATPPENSKP